MFFIKKYMFETQFYVEYDYIYNNTFSSRLLVFYENNIYTTCLLSKSILYIYQ